MGQRGVMTIFDLCHKHPLIHRIRTYFKKILYERHELTRLGRGSGRMKCGYETGRKGEMKAIYIHESRERGLQDAVRIK